MLANTSPGIPLAPRSYTWSHQKGLVGRAPASVDRNGGSRSGTAPGVFREPVFPPIGNRRPKIAPFESGPRTTSRTMGMYSLGSHTVRPHLVTARSRTADGAGRRYAVMNRPSFLGSECVELR